MVGFAFVSSQGHAQIRLDRALWLHGNVGFGVSLQASGRANPRIKIEDVCTLHRGVSTFLILGWGPNIPTLVPRNTVRLGFMPFFMPVPEGGVR